MITTNGLNIIEMQRKTGVIYREFMSPYNNATTPDFTFEHLPITTRDGTVIQVCNRNGGSISYVVSGSTHYAVGCYQRGGGSFPENFILPTTYFYPVATGTTPTNVINNPGGSWYNSFTFPLIGTGTNAESLSDYDITDAQIYTSASSTATQPCWYYSCKYVSGCGDMLMSFTNATGQSVDISELGLFWTNYNTTSTDNVNKARNGVLWFRKVFTPITVDDGDTINFRFKRNFDISIS